MMNWVGGARSRVKQSQEKKIQKEFFARQRLAKKVNIKQSSPKGRRKPVSLDLLSLQTINQTYQGENGLRKQPVKVVLGDRSNLLPRRQEDLELPMSPIRNPSNLTFLDSRTEMDTHPRHIPHQLQSHQKQSASSTSSLLVSDSRGKPSDHTEYSNVNLPLPTTSRAVINNVSLLTESFLSFRNSQEQQFSSVKQQKVIKQGKDLSYDQHLPLHRKDILAFQRAEKEKCLSLKPLAEKRPHQAGAGCIAKPVATSCRKHDNNQLIDDENPTTVNMSWEPPTAACVTQTSEKSTIKSNASNDGLSDTERKTLLGLDYDREQDPYDTISHTVPAKKTKISSFEEMISNYEKPATSKKSSKSVTSDNNNYAWWKFVTHEKSSPNDDTCKVPDIVSMEPPAADRKATSFFKQKLPKKSIAAMKRPPTVLQELLCLDEDLNNSDLFQTQDFTFEDAIAVDFEEPLKQFQHYTTNLKAVNNTTNDNNVNDHNAILPCEEVKISDQQDHNELEVQSPKKVPSNTISSISVGIQCSESVCDVATQTKQQPVLKHSSTQSDSVQLVDTAVQASIANTSSSSVMTQTSELIDEKCLNHHPSTSHPDDLAVAQSTIVWQSLMIKMLQIDASTPLHT